MNLSEAAWALVWALLLWVANDLVSIDSHIRSVIGRIKNKLAEQSVGRLRRRIAKLEVYRELLISSTDKFIYLGVLMGILGVLMLMCMAGLVALGDSLGFLQGGKVFACCILSFTIGVSFAILRFHALDTDMKQKVQKLIIRVDKDISSLQEKLEKRI